MTETEFWFISTPSEPSPEKSYHLLKDKISDISDVHKLRFPEFKVGTLDTLVGLIDELQKLDTSIDITTRKLAGYLMDLLKNENQGNVVENFVVNRMPIPEYVKKFSWEIAKFPVKQPLPALAEMIGKQVAQIDQDLKIKSSQYNTIRNQLEAITRKNSGSLLTRSLADLVDKNQFVLDSEYLQTVLVVVPKSQGQEWLNCYEKLTDMIVPRSCTEITADSEHHLYSVTLFSKVLDEFKTKARERKFIMRDFRYNEDELKREKFEHNKLELDIRNNRSPLLRWLKVNFSECLTALTHVKILRLFVESVVRYGPSTSLCSATICISGNKRQKKVRDALNSLYSHLDSNVGAPTQADVMEVPGLNLLNQDYYPYVFSKLEIDYLHGSSS